MWSLTKSDKYQQEKLTEQAQRTTTLQAVGGGGGRRRIVLSLLLLGLVMTVAGYFFFFYRSVEGQEHPVVDFDEKFAELCKDPKLPMPVYKGPESFFKYIMNPETDFCYSWVQFGGEKQPVPGQSDEACNDEIRKEKFMCFNEEFKANHDPCLVYSFEKDQDDQFERDMHLFSCETHVFDHKKVIDAEHLRRSEFWYEHNWDISEYPYDVEASKSDTGRVVNRRSLDFITTLLGHKGKEIKYLKSDLEGREWILLKQVFTYGDFADIRQVGARIHLPLKVNQMESQQRNQTLYEYFKILQSMSCAGYRYVLGRPIKYYRGGIKFPEVNRTLYPAYEVNFVKDLNI